MMFTVTGIEQLRRSVGEVSGVSSGSITQDRTNEFASATDDCEQTYVTRERAAQTPAGVRIALGCSPLSPDPKFL